MGGRGSGKTRLGAEWVNGLARGFPPFAPDRRPLGIFALIGETLGDVREVMIDGPSGIATISRGERPRYEPSRRRLLFDNGAVAHVFSSEDPESLRGPQFQAAWCDEAGCAAVDKGPNQPNVFNDPKSAESQIPYFSNGDRSDFAQHSFLSALLSAWNPQDPEFVETANPVSSLNSSRMLDCARIYLWAWDCRPFPAFPARQSVWNDGGNWYTGHWLNGRLSGASAGDVIAAIVRDFDLPDVDVSAAEGFLSGYVIADLQSARSAIEPLMKVFGIRDSQKGGTVSFSSRQAGPVKSIDHEDIVSVVDEPLVTVNRAAIGDLPCNVTLSCIDPMRGYQSALIRAAPVDESPGHVESLVLPAMIEHGAAEVLCAQYRRARRIARTTIEFALTHGPEGFAAGDIVELSNKPGQTYEITALEDGEFRKVAARRIGRLPPLPDLRGLPAGPVDVPAAETAPFACLVDLPLWDSERKPQDQLRVAIWSDPWRPYSVSVSPQTTGFSPRAVIGQPATVGFLEQALQPGFSGRMDFASQIRLFSPDGEFSSVSRPLLLGGANLAAVQCSGGAWEIVQFELVEDLGGGSWLLSNLLRGQAGTEDAAISGSAAGSRFVLLDEAVLPAGLQGNEIGLDLTWRIEPATGGVGGAIHVDMTQAGGLRALMPYAPVHLRADKLPDGAISFSWIRRGRTDADGWLGTEIPLDEEYEAYLVEISQGGPVIRSREVSAPAWVYEAAEIAADFGSQAAGFQVTVRQQSTRVGPGLPAIGSYAI